jgi:N-sulfoglucosamine sulfohydrolase
MEDGPNIYMPVDIHKSLSGQVVREEYYVPNDQEEMYDMEKDRLEETNLINDPEYSQIASELRAKARTWMEETNDPILSGPIPGVESTQWAQEAAKGLTYRRAWHDPNNLV